MASKFETFSERARRSLNLAQEEAQSLQHEHISTEHVLLGLLREPEGVAARVLKVLAVNQETLRRNTLEAIGRGERTSQGMVGLTDEAKEVIEETTNQAREMHHTYMGTEHLLLGIIKHGKSRSASALEEAGASYDAVEKAVTDILNRPTRQSQRRYPLAEAQKLAQQGLDMMNQRDNKNPEKLLAELRKTLEDIAALGRDDPGRAEPS